MGSARKRKRRSPTLEARVERAGHVALTAVWSAMVRGIGAALRWLGAGSARAARWTAALPLRSQIALAIALAAAVFALGHYLTRERPIYVDDDGEALARVIHSECGHCSRHKQVHIAWATRNLAEFRGQSIAEMVCSPCGKQERGRPVSSRLAANDADRALASYILGAPALADPTDGARHFINPRLQDKLAAAGDRPGYRGNPYRVVRNRWMNSYGWEPYYRLGPDLELWGPKRAKKTRRRRR